VTCHSCEQIVREFEPKNEVYIGLTEGKTNGLINKQNVVVAWPKQWPWESKSYSEGGSNPRLFRCKRNVIATTPPEHTLFCAFLQI
jgi:hypothetical protein